MEPISVHVIVFVLLDLDNKNKWIVNYVILSEII